VFVGGRVRLSDIESKFFMICRDVVATDLSCVAAGPREAVWRMEDLTTSPAYFRRAFLYITQGCCEVDDGYLDAVFSLGKVNVHAECEELSPPYIYARWPDSFKYIFCSVVESFGIEEVSDAYSSFGYWLPDIVANSFVVDGGRIVINR